MPRVRKRFLSVSEFTFGYQFLFEQTLDFQDELLCMPILPNLRQEGSLGWDACLPTRGGCLFFQFKKSECMVNRNADCVKPNPYFNNFFRTPCFRIKICEKGNHSQYIQLRDWSQRFPWTFYVAPEISTDTNYFTYSRNLSITNHSRFINVRNCRDYPDTDNDSHYIVFHPDVLEPRICSRESHPIEGSILGIDWRSFLNKIIQDPKKLEKIDFTFTEELLNTCIRLSGLKDAAVEESELFLKRIPRKRFEEITKIDRNLFLISNLLSAYFGITLVIFGPKRK